MSEYWKSTPKYWCKFCKTYVRDTALERKQHDATPKHQNNIQKSLREIHKNRDREEREKQRAKDEVARLNSLVGGKPAASSPGPSVAPAPIKKAPPHFTKTPQAQATPEERKRQMSQLAAMGIAIPQEYRRDMAIASEWSTVSETPVYREQEIKEEEDDDGDRTKLAVTSIGVRKRKAEDDEDEEEAAPKERKAWGSRFKSYPGASGGGEEDLDALLSGATAKEMEVKKEDESKELLAGLKKEESVEGASAIAFIPDVNDPAPPLKQEDGAADAPVRKEEGLSMPPVVFKKRKGLKH
ncbi:hypothetical protein H2203_003075 [Taxawa tesnikishii (nom. ined.)]|nr:hypothetical protein H2203_003075 [Dothideales sp. JES 119]